MFADTRPADLGADGGLDRRGEFRVAQAPERMALLRQLRDGSVPVHLSAPDGCAITATLWSVDDDGIGFNVDPGSPQFAQLLDGNEAVAVAYLDAVKLQFDLDRLLLVRGPQAATLRSALPHEVYRFQRRQSYRVRTAERSAPQVQLRHPAIPEMQLTLRVLDVSLGGCALWQPDTVPPIAAGTCIAEVEVALDAETRFDTELTLQHVSSLSLGARGVRLGCEWTLHGDAERSLQRWIDQAQKRRRLMTLP
jgi:flagellar brake protein